MGAAIFTRRFFPIVIILLAFGLRFYQLDAQSFWNDEGNSARLSERSLALIIEGTAADVHPPLYYLVLRGWRELVGEQEFGLRSLSAFAGVLVVGLAMGVGRQVAGRWPVVVLAGLLTAVHPALIYYSQETRMYALLTLWALLATWLLLRLAVGKEGLRWQVVVAYVLCLAAGLYTHYFFPAVMAAHGAILVAWLLLSRQSTLFLLKWLAMAATAVLLYAPWLPIFLRQIGGRAESDVTLLQFLRQAGYWLAFGETLPLGWGLWLLAGLLVLALGNGRLRGLVPFLAVAVPLLFMFAAGSVSPQYYKFLGTAVPFLCLLLALAIYDLRFTIYDLRFTIGGLLLLGYGFFVLLSLQNLYTNPAYARADYRAMAARIAADEHPNAGIVLDAPNQWEAFTYYHRQGAPVYPLPTGLSQPTPEQIDAQLTEIAGQHDRLYAIFWGEAQRDPERLVERWLDEYAFKATDEWVGDVRFVVYALPAEAAQGMATAVALPFGEHITLNGYTLNGQQFQAGDIVQVTLFWQTAVALTNRYKIFLHLLNQDGQLIAQRDSEPGGSLNLTTIWPPGESISDNHGLLIPAATPPGTYTLLLGLYDIADPASRLPIHTANGVQDAITLVTFQIRN